VSGIAARAHLPAKRPSLMTVIEAESRGRFAAALTKTVRRPRWAIFLSRRRKVAEFTCHLLRPASRRFLRMPSVYSLARRSTICARGRQQQSSCSRLCPTPSCERIAVGRRPSVALPGGSGDKIFVPAHSRDFAHDRRQDRADKRRGFRSHQRSACGFSSSKKMPERGLQGDK
jgi:hypothetical protein